jgi:hypothetical protein
MERNVDYKVEKGKLVITVDLTKKGEPSGSGKSEVIGTTSGNIELVGAAGVYMGLNVYKKK